MYIFIDESGSFRPGDTIFNCIAAVVMPEICKKNWLNKYSELDKGSKTGLDEAQEIIKFLAKNEAKIFIVLIKLDINPDEIVETFTRWFKEESLKNNVNIANILNHCLEKLDNLSRPIRLKILLIVQLLENTVRGMLKNTNNYKKLDLENLCFVLDNLSNNNDQKKDHLSLIKNLLFIKLNGDSQSNPIECDNLESIQNFTHKIGLLKFLDCNLLLKNIQFDSDDNDPGVKAADCVTNFIYGMIKENENRSFDDNTIKNFEKLLIKDHSIDLLHFNKDEPFIDIDKLSENGKNVCNKINIESYMVCELGK